MHIRDLGPAAAVERLLIVRAVDGAGNIGPEAKVMFSVSSRVAAPLPGTPVNVNIGGAQLPRLGGGQVAILDELDKVQPVTGELIPSQPEGYLAANHLWDGGLKMMRLHAARNEFVGFQILLRGPIGGARPSLKFPGEAVAKVRVEFGRYRHVGSGKGPLPDPIVPLDQAESIPGQKSSSLHADVYIPHDMPAGDLKGTLALEAGGQRLTIGVLLRVWDFTLPDYLSFLPEMNAYGLPADEHDYYRLAHAHRTFLNRLPYNQDGAMQEGCAPAWDGKTLDWRAWDRRFGPLLDGSAFVDLPRSGVPARRVLPAAPRELADADRGELQRRLLGRPRLQAEPIVQPSLRSSRQWWPSTLHEKGWNDDALPGVFSTIKLISSRKAGCEGRRPGCSTSPPIHRIFGRSATSPPPSTRE